MMLDKTTEKLRSKHVRTLELLQKTLDENVELRDQLGRLKKAPTTPRSNRAAALEDEIDRLKAEQCAKLLEAEEASKKRLAELAQSVELLQKKTLKLQNQVFTLETSLFHTKETLAAEKTRWEDERARLQDENAQLRNEAEAHRATQSAEDRAARLEREVATHLEELGSHRAEVASFGRQIASAREREAVLAQELGSFRERNSELQSRLSQLHLQSAASQQHADAASRLIHAEEKNEALSRENRSLFDQLSRLHAQLAGSTKSNNQSSSSGGGIFAVHVELKRENQQLKAQVEDLKQLQKRFLTTAKKKTMSFPAI